MTHSKLSLNHPNGKVRATDPHGNYCVTLQDFKDVGWCDDTARYCRFTGIIAKVAVVDDSRVWETAPEANLFELNDY